MGLERVRGADWAHENGKFYTEKYEGRGATIKSNRLGKL